MPRKPRIHFPGAIYHVITRGNNKDTIFAAKIDKQFYLQKLEGLSRKFNFDLLIFVIMNNHAHLVVRVANIPLSKIMHHLQQAYAIYYNRAHDQSGHVFEGRYKAYLCDNERYLLALLRYIHLNPVTANMVRDLEYPWSSHGYYSGSKRDSLVDTGLIYGMINQEENPNPAGEYLRFMQQTTEELPFPPYISALQKILPERAATDDTLEKTIADITTSYNISRKQLFSRSKSYAITAARKELILTLHHEHRWTNTEIAQLLNVNQSYISRIIADSRLPR